MIDVNPATGDARMRGQSVKVPTITTCSTPLRAAVRSGPARVSYDVRWIRARATRRIPRHDVPIRRATSWPVGRRYLLRHERARRRAVRVGRGRAVQPLTPAVGRRGTGSSSANRGCRYGGRWPVRVRLPLVTARGRRAPFHVRGAGGDRQGAVVEVKFGNARDAVSSPSVVEAPRLS